ncbi:protein ALP1-like [Exaiptasia diaphana]|uniref:Uncharacterized protein n=1 Tax=Exaiptasia diaphana TaxID=2652724 RepID=A0A913Y9H2_EXADI|nr:protein ALP1-like [Exaiptasia diaphana]
MQQIMHARSRSRRIMLLLLTEIRRRRRINRRVAGRRAWSWPRPQLWFRTMLANHNLDVLWKDNFRITRPTFDYICDLVRGDLQKNVTRMRQPVSVEERVGLSIWRLATGNTYRTSCNLNRFIVFPVTRDEVESKIDEFEQKFGIPQIVGAVDGCHIEIAAPPINPEDYFDRKKMYAMYCHVAPCIARYTMV